MKAKIPMIVRILFGLIMFASGLAGLMNAIPVPADMPERLLTFNAGLAATGYFMTLLKVTETVCGALIMTGFFVPLSLVILAPVVLNIFLVHAFMAPSGLPLAIILGLMMIYLSFFAPPSQVIKQLFRNK